MIAIEGFVIISPISPWDKKNRKKIIGDLSHGTFSTTELGAWKRMIHENNSQELTRKIQHFHDRGYRLAKATMNIEIDE